MLGVTWDELPSMAFNLLGGGGAQQAIAYPRGREISKNALFDFLDEVLTGKRKNSLEPISPQEIITSNFSKVKNDTEIEPILLNNTIIATRETFNELVY